MPKQPLVSIIIPTYNRAHLISETLDSVLAQTYTNWECIVVDDGSTDATETLLHSYVEKDKRFQYHKRPDTHLPGGNGARNYGFEVSRGAYINWLDSDDLVSSNKLELQVHVLNKNRDSVATCMWGRFSSDNCRKNLKFHEPYYNTYDNAIQLFEDFSKNGGYFPCHAYLIDREILKNSGLWLETLKVNQDGEFFCRVLISAKSILFVPDATVYYRFNKGDNLSLLSKNKIRERIKSWKIINKHIFKAYGLRHHNYVKSAKYVIYNQMNNNYPYLKFKYPIYFWRQLIREIFLVNYMIKLFK